MGIEPITFVVPGKPLTWARARRSRYGSYFTPEDRENKMSEVRDAWNELGRPPFERGAYLAFGLRVYTPRPQGHYRANGTLTDKAIAARPLAGTYGGDLDNFVKLVLDALSDVAFHDDSQIVEYLQPFGKWYADPGTMPRTEITLAVAGGAGARVCEPEQLAIAA